MFNRFYKELKYRQYIGKNDTGQEMWDVETTIFGVRLKGQFKNVTNEDGDTSTANIAYKVDRDIPLGSKLEGRVVVECYPVQGLWMVDGKCGYIAYVR